MIVGIRWEIKILQKIISYKVSLILSCIAARAAYLPTAAR